MEEITNHKAWDMLLPDERSALTLSIVNNKSTWEAGEIMEKSHYKYLEINQRARYFLKLFKNHLDKFGEVIPKTCRLDRHFHDYLIHTIEFRKSLKKTEQNLDNLEWKRRTTRDIKLVEQMKKLEHGSKADKELWNFIHEFDRWNNFRILPLEIQMVSPYKRRNKAKYKKHLKNLYSLDPNIIKLIEFKLQYTGKHKSVYLLLLTPTAKEDPYRIIKVKDEPRYLNQVNVCGLFVYQNKNEAEELADLILGYLGIGSKSCIDGQRFWPKFREQIRKAYNFKDIENVTPTKKFLSMAFVEDDPILIRKAAKQDELKIDVKTEERIPDDKFY